MAPTMPCMRRHSGGGFPLCLATMRAYRPLKYGWVHAANAEPTPMEMKTRPANWSWKLCCCWNTGVSWGGRGGGLTEGKGAEGEVDNSQHERDPDIEQQGHGLREQQNCGQWNNSANVLNGTVRLVLSDCLNDRFSFSTGARYRSSPVLLRSLQSAMSGMRRLTPGPSSRAAAGPASQATAARAAQA